MSVRRLTVSESCELDIDIPGTSQNDRGRKFSFFLAPWLG